MFELNNNDNKNNLSKVKANLQQLKKNKNTKLVYRV